MKTAIVIINGISFPYMLTDRAIAWAKKENSQLQALFLTSGDEVPEGYFFPSDIDLAENITDIDDSEKDSAQILRSQGKLFKGMLKAEGISGSVEHMNDASLEEVLQKIKSADLVFVAPHYGEMSMQAITRFSLEELVNNAPTAVEVVQ